MDIHLLVSILEKDLMKMTPLIAIMMVIIPQAQRAMKEAVPMILNRVGLI
jgi:hypothetical protein